MMPAGLAFATVAAITSAPARHNFSNDYLVGSWNCTVQAANGQAVRRIAYKPEQGGAVLFESSTTTTAQGRTIVEEAKITQSGGFFRWANLYTGKAWQASSWWHEGKLRFFDPLNGGTTWTLRQAGHGKYTAEYETLTKPPVISTCSRL